MKFIHLTDPHLLSAHQRLFDLDLEERLAAAVASIARRHADAELVMVTGDLAHFGEAGAYAALTEILDGLPCPWYALVGNHDARTAARAALPHLAWGEDGFLQYAVDTAAGRFLVLDTLDEGVPTGRLCQARLQWLRRQLEETGAAGTDVFLFSHHAPFAVGIHGLDAIGLVDAGDLAQVLDGFAHVRHLFFGHLHRACHGSWRGIPFSTVKATAHQIALIIDSETPLTASLENPAYAVVLIGTEGVVIHDHSYLEEAGAFPYRSGPAPA